MANRIFIEEGGGKTPGPHRLFKSLVWGVLFIAVSVSFPTHAARFELMEATISEINSAYKKGELTAERLVQLYLDRIEAYDKKGPEIRAMITVNPNALKEARALDKERREQGSRSLLHPVNQSHGWRKIGAVADLHHTVPPAGGSAGRGELRESGKF